MNFESQKREEVRRVKYLEDLHWNTNYINVINVSVSR